MNFMGIGPLEILLILLIGFLFFGPEKLPEMAAKVGRLYRNFKKASFDLNKTIAEELPTENMMENAKKAIVKDLIDEPKAENAEETTSAPSPVPDEKINE